MGLDPSPLSPPDPLSHPSPRSCLPRYAYFQVECRYPERGSVYPPAIRKGRQRKDRREGRGVDRARGRGGRRGAGKNPKKTTKPFEALPAKPANNALFL